LSSSAHFRSAAIAFVLLGVQFMRAQDLASRLSTPRLRDAAVASIADSGDRNLALLLSWSESPPPGVNPIYLNIGLAQAFGKLRAKEAIPFLIKNITLDVTGLSDNIWMKEDSVVGERLPAAAALVAIGPDASKALVATSWDRMRPDEHMAAVFVISRIADPAARGFLTSLRTTDAREARYVKEGLKAIDAQKAPATR
jgi:hypothetical protein